MSRASDLPQDVIIMNEKVPRNKQKGKKRKVILTGDFNIDPVWHHHNYTMLLSILATFNLSNIVNRPTRVNYKIDHVFTNTHASCQIDYCTFSDHRSILVSTDIHLGYLKGKHFGYEYKRVFTESNIKSLYSDLNEEVWNNVFNKNDIDTAFQAFYEIVLTYFNNNFPLRRAYNKADRNKRSSLKALKFQAKG
nr:unnamed protein product [Callosobruchus chinensis]